MLWLHIVPTESVGDDEVKRIGELTADQKTGPVVLSGEILRLNDHHRQIGKLRFRDPIRDLGFC